MTGPKGRLLTVLTTIDAGSDPRGRQSSGFCIDSDLAVFYRIVQNRDSFGGILSRTRNGTVREGIAFIEVPTKG